MHAFVVSGDPPGPSVAMSGVLLLLPARDGGPVSPRHAHRVRQADPILVPGVPDPRRQPRHHPQGQGSVLPLQVVRSELQGSCVLWVAQEGRGLCLVKDCSVARSYSVCMLACVCTWV